MAKEDKKQTEKKIDKEFENKLKDLKIELLKQPQKRSTIKRNIAKLLTQNNQTKQEENK